MSSSIEDLNDDECQEPCCDRIDEQATTIDRLRDASRGMLLSADSS